MHAEALKGLKRQRPEWEPWLGVVAEILREAGDPEWEATVPDDVEPGRTTGPLLAGAALSLQASAIRRLLDRLIRVAAHGSTPKMATLKAALHTELDPLALFSASLRHDSERMSELAGASGANPDAFQAVSALLPIPFLHACHRRWAPSLSESWVEGYCPLCASWPAFAEVRGIERRRYFRCGRCGGEWHARPLHCAFCGMDDHDELVSLVPEKGDANAVIDACRRCRGYVKTFTRLQGCPRAEVMLEDLASVDLDVAAIQQGYARHAGAGYAFDITIAGKRPRSFFAWQP